MRKVFLSCNNDACPPDKGAVKANWTFGFASSSLHRAPTRRGLRPSSARNMYRLEIKILRRSDGKDSRAAASYRSGEKIGDFDYSKKAGIVGKHLIGWAGTRAELWEANEAKETRKNSQVGREFLVSIPRDIKDRDALVVGFAQWLHSTYGIAADACIHDKRDGNPHAHILTTTRAVTNGREFGEKVRALDPIAAGRNDRENETERIRAKWADMVNEQLKREGESKQVSHLSKKAQGIIAFEPQMKRGHAPRVAAYAVARNFEIRARNKERVEIHNEQKSTHERIGRNQQAQRREREAARREREAGAANRAAIAAAIQLNRHAIDRIQRVAGSPERESAQLHQPVASSLRLDGAGVHQFDGGRIAPAPVGVRLSAGPVDLRPDSDNRMAESAARTVEPSPVFPVELTENTKSQNHAPLPGGAKPPPPVEATNEPPPKLGIMDKAREAMSDAAKKTADALTKWAIALPSPEYLIQLVAADHLDLPAERPRRWKLDTLTSADSVAFLRRKNAQGYHIYGRPADPRFILVDDLTKQPDGLTKPSIAAVVETSPGSFQYWVESDAATDAEALTYCRALRDKFAGDPGAAQPRQVGRLPGFTNQKKKHIEANGGRPPFALLRHAGVVADTVRAAMRQWAKRIRDKWQESNDSTAPVSAALSGLRPDRRGASTSDDLRDRSKEDFAEAIKLARQGKTDAEIAEAMRRKSEKARERGEDYIQQTVRAIRDELAGDYEFKNASDRKTGPKQKL